MSASSSNNSGLYFAYFTLLSAAVLPIYTSSLASLKTPISTRNLLKKLGKKHNSSPDDSDSEDQDSEGDQSETLTSSDAYLFPIFGSVVLFSLYLIFKFLDPKLINNLITAYFAIVGFLAISKVSNQIARSSVGQKRWYQWGGGKWKLKLEKNNKSISHLSFSLLSLPPLLFSFLIITFYILFDRPWPLSNLLALSLAHNAISLISLDSFITGSILLGGLFLYDIFWVFGTDVMVSVARQFEAPVKIVFPKNFVSVIAAYLAGESPIPKWQLTLLGLGDIVIPGVFVALSLRFDQHLASTSNPSINFTKTYRNFPKPYFKSTLLAYILGLSITMSVMHFFKKAQPALLYLSPACVFAVVFMAWKRGELKEAWEWKDGDQEDEKEKESEKGRKKQIGSRDKDLGKEVEINGDGFEDEDEEGEGNGNGNGSTTQVRTRQTSSRRRSLRKSVK